MTTLTAHPVVDHDTWLAARTELLEREKQFTRERDALSAARRDLPWERIEKPYRFFDGRRRARRCPACSTIAAS